MSSTSSFPFPIQASQPSQANPAPLPWIVGSFLRFCPAAIGVKILAESKSQHTPARSGSRVQ